MHDSTSRPGSQRSPLAQCTALLADFIAHRTDNPGGDEIALCERLEQELGARGADEVVVAKVPRPGRETGGYVFARYGSPRFLINVHLDTVPANRGYTRDPFTAEITEDRVYGLGSADTKGAIAAVLVALARSQPRNLGILFSGDEERGSQCIKAFVESEHLAGIERALICEPTRRSAGIGHRGVRAYRAEFHGKGGHSSKADHMPKPMVTMARLAIKLDELGQAYLDQGPEDMKGLCMNVASLDGGVAFNVVPDSATLSWSVRPPPGFDAPAFERIMAGHAAAIHETITVHTFLKAEPFACRDVDAFQRLLGEHVHGFVPLDFWTEAAIFAAHGVDSVVVGPGDIAQAHAPDEFVTLADLDWAIDLFTQVISSQAAMDASREP